MISVASIKLYSFSKSQNNWIKRVNFPKVDIASYRYNNDES